MNEPLISIIINVYNVEPYIEKCLNSVKNQTYKNLEIIVVDDGSLDFSGKICDKFAESDSRFKVIHINHKGLSSARNIGLDAVTGDYIGFVDSDDYCKLDMYEKMYHTMLRTDSDIVICGFHMFDKTNKDFVLPYQELNLDESMKKLIEDEEVKSYLWNKLFKKELWEDIKFSNDCFLEDYGVMHKIFLKINKTTIMNEILYYYRMRNDNITSSFDNKMDEIIASYEKRRFDLKNTKFYSLAIIREMEYIRYTIKRFIFQGKYSFKFYKKITILLKQILKEERTYISSFLYIKNILFLAYICFIEKLKILFGGIYGKNMFN